jgi:hypothetical protein
MTYLDTAIVDIFTELAALTAFIIDGERDAREASDGSGEENSESHVDDVEDA